MNRTKPKEDGTEYNVTELYPDKFKELPPLTSEVLKIIRDNISSVVSSENERRNKNGGNDYDNCVCVKTTSGLKCTCTNPGMKDDVPYTLDPDTLEIESKSA